MVQSESFTELKVVFPTRQYYRRHAVA
jgi:hypothetical protein